MQRAEQHKQRQAANKVAHRWHLYVILQRVVVLVNQLAAQLVRILCRGLPEERCKVVVVRSFSATLIVDKPRIAVVVEHHIARLEVAIQECVALLCSQILCQQSEVGLQLQLVEVNLRSLQEAVLKVVQVEQHAVNIKLSLRIAIAEVESARAVHLHVRQLAYSALQQLLLLQRVSSASFTTAANGIKQRHAAEVGLQVSQLIVACRKNLWHRQFQAGKVLGKIYERVVFIATCTNRTHHRLSVLIRQSVIRAIASSSGNLLNISRLSPLPLLI